MAKRSLALLTCLAALLAVPVSVQADTGSIVEPNTEPPDAANGWQAATCKTDEPVLGQPAIHCSPNTPSAFYALAGGHPPIGFTQYLIKHQNGEGKVEPSGIPVSTAVIQDPAGAQSIKTLRIDLPPGLTVNPNATPKCSLAEFENKVGEFHVPACAEGTIVGREEITLVTTVAGVPAPSPPFPAGNSLPQGFIIGPSEASGTKVPVYNLVPNKGEPALFGFVAVGKEVVFLRTDVSWESDFHEAFTIELPKQEPPFATLRSRLVNFGQEAGNQGLVEEGDGTFLNNPTTCLDPGQFPSLYSTWFRAQSYGEEDPTFPAGSTPFESPVESSTAELIRQGGCDTVPFKPGLEVAPGASAIDSPAGPTIETTLEYLSGKDGEQQESHLRRAVVALPQGLGLNPSGARGLQACGDAQFKKGVRTYGNECPAASRVGTVTIDSPPLARPLTGDVYLGEQKSRDPESGDEFRILVEAKEEEEGIDVRLVGRVRANPGTGQLTAVFDEQQVGQLAGTLPEGLPQVPFTSVKLHFDQARAVLTSPPTCAAATTRGEMTPWARPGEVVTITSKPFVLSADPAGGSCPTTMAERKFAPLYQARTDSTTAGAYSPLRVTVSRSDGEQELKAVDVTLPKGLTGKLGGIPYCSETAIAAAAGRSGREEQVSPSCSAQSLIGSATTLAGSGSDPLELAGKVYLAGPYAGAALSLVAITPALAGPFDLGTVVVRVALHVEPETAQIHAVSDPIPDVFGGVKLDLRSIALDLDRSQFVVNPTSCATQATTGSVEGGGADPTNPAAFSSHPVDDPFAATGCGKLGFSPKLEVRLHGPTRRAENPRLEAILTARKGQANLARAAVTMPHSLFLDQRHIGAVCTRPQLASHTCPSASVYGSAEAKSPLLKEKLRGKVFLVSSSHQLPDLLVDLRGQVEIYLRGVISTKRGGLKTVFNNTPDVPVSKLVLKLKGGKKSLLINSTDICARTQRAVVHIKGQNGRKVTHDRQKLAIASCGER